MDRSVTRLKMYFYINGTVLRDLTRRFCTPSYEYLIIDRVIFACKIYEMKL